MEGIDLATSYGHIHVYKKGNGIHKIVLLHGSGCDSAMLSWKEVMNQFNEDYTVYAPDLLGYGKSDKPTDLCGTRFYQTHIDCLKEMVDLLNLNSFSLAGLSMGGAIGIGFALKYPERVQCLFPVDSWGLVKKLPMHRLCNWYMQKTNMTQLQYRWLSQSHFLAKWSIGYSLIGDKHKITEDIIQEVMSSCRGDLAGKSMQDYQRSSCNVKGTYPFYDKALSKLTMPVIFINGEKDTLVPPSASKAAAKLVLNGSFHILIGCKHWSVKEKPTAFCQIVKATLRTVLISNVQTMEVQNEDSKDSHGTL